MKRNSVYKEFRFLCEELLLHVDSKRPRRVYEIVERLENDYGTVGERRFYRALKHLLETGAIKRIGKVHSRASYVRLVTET